MRVGIGAMFYALFLPLDKFAFGAFVFGALFIAVIRRQNFISDFYPANFCPARLGRSAISARYSRFSNSHFFAARKIFAIAVAISLLAISEQISTVWVAKHSGDTTNYHAQIVAWLNFGGDVWGVGNLQALFAINSLYLTVAALLDNGIFDGRSAWILPALYAWTALGYFFCEWIFSRDRGARIYAAIFSALIILTCFPFLTFGLLQRKLEPSLYYDFPVTILHALVFLEIYHLWRSRENSTGDNLFAETCARRIILFATGAFLIKPLGAVTVVFSFAAILWDCRFRENWRRTLRLFIFPAVAFAVWLGGNLILSGYPLYPLPYFPLKDLSALVGNDGAWGDWTMSLATVKSQYAFIVGWARNPADEWLLAAQRGVAYWLPIWLKNQICTPAFWVYALIPLTLGAARYCRNWREISREKYLFVGGSALAAAYWLISAPDLRFALTSFWAFAGSSYLLFPAKPRTREDEIRRTRFLL